MLTKVNFSSISLRFTELAVSFVTQNPRVQIKTPCIENTAQKGCIFYGGEGEIRTRGELPHAGFQDQYHQPLGHLSVYDIFQKYTTN